MDHLRIEDPLHTFSICIVNSVFVVNHRIQIVLRLAAAPRFSERPIRSAFRLFWAARTGAGSPLTVSVSEPRPWRSGRTPYLRDVMDALSASSPLERVVFMKGAQLGATEGSLNWVG
ncbi:phage terminase large subunit family protein [Bradyrhizobium sp. 150]|uniref:phage terminase large subunit family protein n=1 Tax=Bradyrhizobium sp. 150 TaxID=2782625 RepID=UPI0021133297|nr:phage terminase large subunit family protein [Bradyrhizobium sp. 150]